MKALKLIPSLLISFTAAGIGTLATTPNIPTWYAGLNKPFFSPPNWLFGPVWTLLYICIGISLWLVWTCETKKSKSSAYYLFGAQLILNAAWSLVFFGLHQPWLGVVTILALDGAVILTMRAFKPFSPRAAQLLVPYLAWISFATCLNLGIALLN